MKKLKWGILSTAKIGIEKVIPGMLKSDLLEVHAIASRSKEQAKQEANKLGIPKSYGSYEELLTDTEIDIIYNPLPNHLHVEWTTKAIEAGKHLLCEKPLFLKNDQVQGLIASRDKYKVKVGEAFMVRTHPQWLKIKEILNSGTLGEVYLYNATFSYFNDDPKNIRNIMEYGGGAIWDIGCYPVMTSRYLFGQNPTRVLCSIKKDENFGTDILSSVILEYPNGKRATFTVSTQLAPYQRVHLIGTKKELEIQIPFNAPNDRPTLLKIDSADILQENLEKIEIDTCDQYQLEAEAFTRAVLNNESVPVSLEDAADHCRIINAMFESAETGKWVGV